MKKIAYGGLGLLAAGLGVALIVVADSGSSAGASSTPLTTSVTVFGSNTTMRTPNHAQVLLGVTNQSASAQSALASNNRIMDRVVSQLEKLGIAKINITTSGLNINPNYSQANPPSVTGYQVSDNLTVDTKVGLAGAVIDQAVAAGANQINGINLMPLRSSLYKKAYASALKNARLKAQAVALGLGEHIVGAISVQVQSSGSLGTPIYFGAAQASSTPIYPGQQQDTLTLKVIYRLGP